MLRFSFRLLQGTDTLFSLSAMHRRLSGFLTGHLSSPDSLRMQISITFPNTGMMDAFVDSLLILGYKLSDLSLYQLTAAFCFTSPRSVPQKVPSSINNGIKIFSRSYWLTIANRLCMKSYLLLTRPFEDAGPPRLSDVLPAAPLSKNRLHGNLRQTFSAAMSYYSRLSKAFENALHLPLTPDSKYILMSDCHRGNGTSTDNFLKNQNLFLQHFNIII